LWNSDLLVAKIDKYTTTNSAIFIQALLEETKLLRTQNTSKTSGSKRYGPVAVVKVSYCEAAGAGNRTTRTGAQRS
jgi:hypothetical protein